MNKKVEEASKKINDAASQRESEILKMLEPLIDGVSTGEIVGIAYVAVRRDRPPRIGWSGLHPFAFLGGVNALNHQLNMRNTETIGDASKKE